MVETLFFTIPLLQVGQEKIVFMDLEEQVAVMEPQVKTLLHLHMAQVAAAGVTTHQASLIALVTQEKVALQELELQALCRFYTVQF